MALTQTQVSKTLVEQYISFLELPSWDNVKRALEVLLANIESGKEYVSLSYFANVVKALINSNILREEDKLEVLSFSKETLELEVEGWEGEEYLRTRVTVEPDTSIVVYEVNDSSELVDEEYIEEEGDEVDKRLNELMELEYSPRLVKRYAKRNIQVLFYESGVCYTSYSNIPHTHCYPSRITEIAVPTPLVWGVLRELPTIIEILELLLLD